MIFYYLFALISKDTVMQSLDSDGVKRAFVIGRPPGHHAGPSGCVPSRHFWRNPDMTSSGFCLLNTVAGANVNRILQISNFF